MDNRTNFFLSDDLADPFFFFFILQKEADKLAEKRKFDGLNTLDYIPDNIGFWFYGYFRKRNVNNLKQLEFYKNQIEDIINSANKMTEEEKVTMSEFIYDKMNKIDTKYYSDEELYDLLIWNAVLNY